MLEMPQTLPSDPDELRALPAQLRDLARAQALKIEKLEHQLAGHRKARFGSKSKSLDQLAFDLHEDADIAAAAATQQEEDGQDGDPHRRSQDQPHRRTCALELAAKLIVNGGHAGRIRLTLHL